MCACTTGTPARAAAAEQRRGAAQSSVRIGGARPGRSRKSFCRSTQEQRRSPAARRAHAAPRTSRSAPAPHLAPRCDSASSAGADDAAAPAPAMSARADSRRRARARRPRSIARGELARPKLSRSISGQRAGSGRPGFARSEPGEIVGGPVAGLVRRRVPRARSWPSTTCRASRAAPRRRRRARRRSRFGATTTSKRRGVARRAGSRRCRPRASRARRRSARRERLRLLAPERAHLRDAAGFTTTASAPAPAPRRAATATRRMRATCVGVVREAADTPPDPRAARRAVLAEVDAAHVLAHDQHVDALEPLRAHDRTGAARAGERAERHELAVEVEVRAQIVDEAAADRAAEEGAAGREDRLAEARGLRAELGACLPAGGEADRPAVPDLDGERAALVGHGVEHRERGADDLGADALAGERTDHELGARCGQRLPAGERPREKTRGTHGRGGARGSASSSASGLSAARAAPPRPPPRATADTTPGGSAGSTGEPPRDLGRFPIRWPALRPRCRLDRATGCRARPGARAAAGAEPGRCPDRGAGWPSRPRARSTRGPRRAARPSAAPAEADRTPPQPFVGGTAGASRHAQSQAQRSAPSSTHAAFTARTPAKPMAESASST